MSSFRRSRPEDTKLLHILRQRPSDIEVKKYAVKLLADCGAFARTYDVLAQLDTDLRREVDVLGGNHRLTELLDQLANWKMP